MSKKKRKVRAEIIKTTAQIKKPIVRHILKKKKIPDIQTGLSQTIP